VITAAFYDGASVVPVSSMNGAVILLDASEASLTFADDGTGADEVAGDYVYTASFSGASLCGGYRVKASATASTSEGTVTREQILTFDARIPNDAVRDPCDADEDDDGLLDDVELDVYRTNPVAPDTDGDGLTDGEEVNVTGTDPLNPDTDADGPLDGADNCPVEANTGQENGDSGPPPPAGDSAWIDNGPGVAQLDDTVPNGDDAGDACDGDTDNDGLLDDDELSASACGAFDLSATTHRNPIAGDYTNDDDGDGDPAPPMGTDASDDGPSWDTDSDGYLDGAECALGANPRDAASKPTTAACGGLADSDLDGLTAAVETCRLATRDDAADSDGDGLADCVEVNDNNGDNVQNFAGDTISTTRAANGIIAKAVDFDLNGDGVVNFAGDGILSARIANHVDGICS